MDFLDLILTMGNTGLLQYWHTTFGWAYVLIKLLIYAAMAGGLIFWLMQKFKHKYSVDIQVVGTNGGVTEFSDTAKYVDGGIKLKLRRRKIVIPAPEKKYITYIAGSFFLKGKIRLYQYGETEFSYTPIELVITEDDKIKFNPIDPKLSMLESLNRGSKSKFGDKKSVFIQYAPVLIGLTFVVASFIMLLFAIEQIKPLLASSGSLINQASLLLEQAKNVPPQVVSASSGVIY